MDLPVLICVPGRLRMLGGGSSCGTGLGVSLYDDREAYFRLLWIRNF